MKAKNKIITAILLSAGAAVGTALINKYIKMSAISRNLLAQPEPRCYRWRLGNIYYTKTGTGKPLLLVHDLTHASSSCEWDSFPTPSITNKATKCCARKEIQFVFTLTDVHRSFALS